MGPFIKDNNNTSKMMRNLVIALIPIILFSEYKNGVIPYINGKVDLLGLIYPIIFTLTGILSSYVIEEIFCKMTKKESKFSIIPGLFISLVLPLNTPLIILIFGVFMGIIFGKMLYGGFGYNIFNPALIGCLFVLATYSSVIVSSGGYLNSYEVDTIASATPLSNVVEGIGTYDNLVKPYGSLLNFFLGFIPGSPGETSSLLCILGFIYLAYNKVIKVRIPIYYVSTVFVLTFIIGSLNGHGLWYPIYSVLSGGLLFGSIFMATDPVTSPVTKYGCIIYGIMLGILTVVMRYLTPYPEGVLTSILIMNMFTFTLDKIGTKTKNYLSKIVISLTVIIISSILLVFNINNKLNSDIDTDFKVLEKTTDNGVITYVVTEKGFKGDIKAEVKISNDKVISYTILECHDDYLKVVEKEDYVSRLIENSNIDTVSGATKTSTALKKLINNVKKDSGIYEG